MDDVCQVDKVKIEKVGRRQTDRQTDRQTARQAGRQTDRQTDRYVYTYIHTHIYIYRYIHTFCHIILLRANALMVCHFFGFRVGCQVRGFKARNFVVGISRRYSI